MTDGPRMDLLARRDRALAHVTMQRPDALNALTREMKSAFAAALGGWVSDPNIYAIVLDSSVPGAFCAGADLAEFREPLQRLDEILDIQAEETRLLWQIECCVKPMVSLIDGLVMGSGVGISMFGTHRVAGDGYSFAMPETGIGYFPDAGATYFLGRLPDHMGVYLGLTGARVRRADALALGLVTHCIRRKHFDDIRRALTDADPVDPLLDDRHERQAPGELAALRPAIARCFGGETVEQIIAALSAETGETRAWAERTLATLAQRAPASLKITLRQLRTAAASDLKTALEMEYAMATGCLARADFQEGIRTLLIDKGSTPRWTPATLADVTPGMVEAAFAPAGGRTLVLPPRPRSLVALG
jgi:enoyl-CoA hydratase